MKAYRTPDPRGGSNGCQPDTGPTGPRWAPPSTYPFTDWAAGLIRSTADLKADDRDSLRTVALLDLAQHHPAAWVHDLYGTTPTPAAIAQGRDVADAVALLAESLGMTPADLETMLALGRKVKVRQHTRGDMPVTVRAKVPKDAPRGEPPDETALEWVARRLANTGHLSPEARHFELFGMWIGLHYAGETEALEALAVAMGLTPDEVQDRAIVENWNEAGPWAPPATDPDAWGVAPVSVDTCRLLVIDPGYLPLEAQAEAADLVARGLAAVVHVTSDGGYLVAADGNGRRATITPDPTVAADVGYMTALSGDDGAEHVTGWTVAGYYGGKGADA